MQAFLRFVQRKHSYVSIYITSFFVVYDYFKLLDKIEEMSSSRGLMRAGSVQTNFWFNDSVQLDSEPYEYNVKRLFCGGFLYMVESKYPYMRNIVI